MPAGEHPTRMAYHGPMERAVQARLVFVVGALVFCGMATSCASGSGASATRNAPGNGQPAAQCRPGEQLTPQWYSELTQRWNRIATVHGARQSQPTMSAALCARHALGLALLETGIGDVGQLQGHVDACVVRAGHGLIEHARDHELLCRPAAPAGAGPRPCGRAGCPRPTDRCADRPCLTSTARATCTAGFRRAHRA